MVGTAPEREILPRLIRQTGAGQGERTNMPPKARSQAPTDGFPVRQQADNPAPFRTADQNVGSLSPGHARSTLDLVRRGRLRLELPPGTWTALPGASGIGKSMLLRLIAGLPCAAPAHGCGCSGLSGRAAGAAARLALAFYGLVSHAVRRGFARFSCLRYPALGHFKPLRKAVIGEDLEPLIGAAASERGAQAQPPHSTIMGPRGPGDPPTLSGRHSCDGQTLHSRCEPNLCRLMQPGTRLLPRAAVLAVCFC